MIKAEEMKRVRAAEKWDTESPDWMLNHIELEILRTLVDTDDTCTFICIWGELPEKFKVILEESGYCVTVEEGDYGDFSDHCVRVDWDIV